MSHLGRNKEKYFVSKNVSNGISCLLWLPSVIISLFENVFDRVPLWDINNLIPFGAVVDFGKCR